MPIQHAVDRVNQFKADSLTRKIKQAQQQVTNAGTDDIKKINASLGVDQELLAAAAAVKQASAQIDVVIHSAGILYALPHILDEGEVVESVSLGADNAPSPFDLVTDRRIAEFKFIYWQPKGNAVREKTLFQDFFKLARAQTEKRKYLYLLGTATAQRFLAGDRDAIRALDRDPVLVEDFKTYFSPTCHTVGEFCRAFGGAVCLVDLVEIVPGFTAFLEQLRS